MLHSAFALPGAPCAAQHRMAFLPAGSGVLFFTAGESLPLRQMFALNSLGVSYSLIRWVFPNLSIRGHHGKTNSQRLSPYFLPAAVPQARVGVSHDAPSLLVHCERSTCAPPRRHLPTALPKGWQ